MNWLHHAASYSSILMAFSVVVILYRSQQYKAKGMLDPWRPYLYTWLIAVSIFASVAFILRTSHK
jgi:hypothetical protein